MTGVKTEVGKYYRTRSGEKVGPIVSISYQSYPFTTMTGRLAYNTWTADGFYIIGRKGSPMDLVAEWVDEPAPDQHANYGWVEWRGGACPVPGDSIVNVRHRDGCISVACPASEWSWLHDPATVWSAPEADIVAYRLVQPDLPATPTPTEPAREPRERDVDEIKIAPAPWRASPQEGAFGHSTVAQVFDANGRIVVQVDPTDDPSVATAIAAKIAEAVNRTFAPGHTDIMVDPETLDDFLKDNPPPSMPAPYYLIHGDAPTGRRHMTLALAEAERDRLAKSSPGTAFTVFRSISRSVVNLPDPTVETYSPDESTVADDGSEF